MKVLIDTNILARMAQPGHPHHLPAMHAVERLRQQNELLFLVPQILYEFWVICTRPIAQNGLELPIAFSIQKLEQALGLFAFLPEEASVYEYWSQLVKQMEVKGKQAHDARIVAAMKAHTIETILTFNAQDFLRYGDIKILNPLDLQSQPSI